MVFFHNNYYFEMCNKDYPENKCKILHNGIVVSNCNKDDIMDFKTGLCYSSCRNGK